MWQKVSPEVYRRLRRLGASHELAEDIVQDVALKVVAKSVPFADASDLARFAHHAARHRWIDLARQAATRRTDASAEVDSVSADVAPAVIESLTARRVLRQLRERDRTALFGDADTTDVMRHRARARLSLLWESLGAWVGAFALRQATRRARKVVYLVGGAAAVVIAVGLPTLHVVSPGPRSDRESVRATAHAASPGSSPRTAEPSAAGAPVARRAPAPAYHGLVTLPPHSADIGPSGAVHVWSRPTQAGDPILCVFKMPVVGTRCVGDASALGNDVP